jgi:hypothetical protein
LERCDLCSGANSIRFLLFFPSKPKQYKAKKDTLTLLIFCITLERTNRIESILLAPCIKIVNDSFRSNAKKIDLGCLFKQHSNFGELDDVRLNVMINCDTVGIKPEFKNP